MRILSQVLKTHGQCHVLLAILLQLELEMLTMGIKVQVQRQVCTTSVLLHLQYQYQRLVATATAEQPQIPILAQVDILLWQVLGPAEVVALIPYVLPKVKMPVVGHLPKQAVVREELRSFITLISILVTTVHPQGHPYTSLAQYMLLRQVRKVLYENTNRYMCIIYFSLHGFTLHNNK